MTSSDIPGQDIQELIKVRIQTLQGDKKSVIYISFLQKMMKAEHFFSKP
jgi:hypothetical protein